MPRLLRLLKILWVSFRYGLDELFLGHERVRALRGLIKFLLFWRTLETPGRCACGWRSRTSAPFS